jgi:acetyl esterase/lipase
MRIGTLAAALLLIALASPAFAQKAADDTCPKGAPDTLAGADSYTYATPDRDLRIHLFQPAGPGPHPAILFFFGGGWRIGSVTAFEEQAHAFAAHGYAAAVADYRISCRDKSTAVESTADAQAAYAWLRGHARELKIDPRRIVLSGGSAGGQIALTAAMLAKPDAKPAALVLFNPAVDMVKIGMALHLPPETAAAISPSILPVTGLPPTIIFHGKADHTVPIATTRAFCARMTEAHLSCEMVEYDGQVHGFFHSHALDPAIGKSPYDDTLARSLAFVDRVGVTK